MEGIRFCRYEHGQIPSEVRQAWSEATADSHLDTQTPESLHERVIYGVVIRAGQRLVGFGAIYVAHGATGEALWARDGKQLLEFGGAWIHPDYRGGGLSVQLMAERMAYARMHLIDTYRIVCVSTVPQIQHICRDRAGMLPVTDPKLLDVLCWQCDGGLSGCGVCPLAPSAAWELVHPNSLSDPDA